jgi:hypothetical protein
MPTGVYVRSITPPPARFWRSVRKTDNCWLWMKAKNNLGYGVFQEGHGTRLAHRYAWTVECGEIPAGLSVCHHCDNPSCVRLDHLFLGTDADNHLDSIRKGRYATGTRGVRGERNPLAKLTAEQVRDIRQRYAGGGVTKTVLGRLFGVSRQNIRDIVRRKTWIAA